MRRREFIKLFGGAAAAWPSAARAQQRVNADGPLGRSHFETFKRALEQTGWVEGRNVRTDDRWAGGDEDLVLRVYSSDRG
jgi:putative ABC transport system substrate-binding protein